MKEWLIAHRGIRSTARENTLKAFLAVKDYPVGWVELDVHSTCDNVLVVHHDFNIGSLIIKNTAFSDLKTADPELITLKEALQAVANCAPIVIEIKQTIGSGHIQVAKVLKSNPGWRVASYDINELFKQAEAGVEKNRMFLYSHKKHPLQLLKQAEDHGFGGIGISSYLLCPIAIWLTNRKGMQIFTYTLNLLPVAWVMRKLFPYLGICTDRPDLLQKL